MLFTLLAGQQHKQQPAFVTRVLRLVDETIEETSNGDASMKLLVRHSGDGLYCNDLYTFERVINDADDDGSGKEYCWCLLDRFCSCPEYAASLNRLTTTTTTIKSLPLGAGKISHTHAFNR